MDKIQNDKSRRAVVKMGQGRRSIKGWEVEYKIRRAGEKRGEEETGSRIKRNEEWKEGKG